MTTPTIMLVAAEASGDTLGANLILALRRRLPDARFVGVGGPRMAQAGVQSPFDIAQLSVFGVFEALAIYSKVVARVKDTVALAAREKPDVAILIDSWGFTVRAAKALRKLNPNIRLIKYVGPQIWASRPGRAKVLAESFDHLLAILPFDAPAYAPYALPVTFVGNPHLTVDFSQADGGRLRREIGAGEDDPVLLVLPGSRRGEIERVMPAFEDAVHILKARWPELHIVVPAADPVTDLVDARVAGWPFRAHVVRGEASKRDAMKAATVALACSGTVTTEVALAGAPLVVGYRIGAASYAIAKHLVLTKWIVLLNIAAGRTIVPELVQDDCTGPKLAAEVAARLENPALRARQIEDQDTALATMGRGAPDPAEKAADVVAGYLT